MSDILHQFTQKKHEFLRQDKVQTQNEDIEIDISKLIFDNAHRKEIEQTLKDEKYGYYDELPDDADIIMLDEKGVTKLCI